MEKYGYVSAMKRYFQFSGRSPRKEFWMFALGYIILLFIAVALDSFLFGVTAEPAADGAIGGSAEVNRPILTGIVLLAHLIPGLSVSIRRLHDFGRSGWWWLLNFVPIGGFVLLFFYCKNSQPDDNQWGPHPYGAVDPNIFGRGE